MMLENEERLAYKILCANMGILPLPDVSPIELIRDAHKGMREIYDRGMEKQRKKIDSQKRLQEIIPWFEKAGITAP